LTIVIIPQARASCSREFSGVVAKYKADHLEMKPLKLPPVSSSPINFVLMFANCFIEKGPSIISSYFAGSVIKRHELFGRHRYYDTDP
jgi:hypothetical protein